MQAIVEAVVGRSEPKQESHPPAPPEGLNGSGFAHTALSTDIAQAANGSEFSSAEKDAGEENHLEKSSSHVNGVYPYTPQGNSTEKSSPKESDLARPTQKRKPSLWATLSRHAQRPDDPADDSTDRVMNGAIPSTSDEDDPVTETATKSQPTSARPAMRRGVSGWTALRDKIKHPRGNRSAASSTSLEGHQLTTELSTGTLPMVILKMGILDRDEHGQRRIPILLNFLTLKITDSIYPSAGRHSVFRIECSYGDGLMRWVIYREMKDFVALHGHYKFANLRQGIGNFPSFPRTSFSQLRRQKGESEKAQSKARFAKEQRQGLETYLLKLIRATMFGPGANRVCKFLEISAFALSLAGQGGEQGKQGYLTIASSGASRRKKAGFHPLFFLERHEPKWFAVRESYIVALEDPANTEIYDVFLFDSSFALERPKRIYRQGIKFFTHGHDAEPDMARENLNADDRAALEQEGPQGHNGAGDPLDPSSTDLAKVDPDRFKDSSNHTFYLTSSERRLRVVAKTERQQDQFIASIEHAVSRSIWAGKNRFDSFAPLRLNVSCQALVDGRDYFYSLSRAILAARTSIMIHDWMLSPELYLRRPPKENEEFRLDRLLKRKAREGVRITVIIYREVSEAFTPVDSQHAKSSLRALHPNVLVQRSPSHTSTGTLLWSHHEKMVVIDETIAFMGGFDLCFGRWDTPAHVLTDDEENEEPIWPGKDFANPRVMDFKELDKPFEDLFDRSKVPRQPWHDIGISILGQPARDLARHFIQRWNMLLRTKNHTIRMPFLIPGPDFKPKELEKLGITGTCEVQICRSVGPWSMGLSDVEHSIQTAYIKAISLSEHHVYIENQFFITSTEVEGTEITNKIGDALVSRIIQAHHDGDDWRADIIMPLVPGYTFPIDHESAGSVRMIMACQNNSIAHGDHSIFARLRREGIDPDDYISFFSLRGWGKFSRTGALTTEGVYIHAKTLIVDDRTVLIGSANINERSQRGDRDSELACVVRDLDMVDSTMGGRPFRVGRFAHKLRIRLMREHVGADVENPAIEDIPATKEPTDLATERDAWDPDDEQRAGADSEVAKKGHAAGWAYRIAESALENSANVASNVTEVAALGLHKGSKNAGATLDKFFKDNIAGSKEAARLDGETDAEKVVEGNKPMEGYSSTVVPTMEEKVMTEQDDSLPSNVKDTRSLPMGGDAFVKVNGEKIKPSANAKGKTAGANAIAASKNVVSEGLRQNLNDTPAKSSTIPAQPAQFKDSDFQDPLAFHTSFMQTAVRNTQAFRKVFRCVPDDLVQTWSQYREYQNWADRHNLPPKAIVPEGKPAPVFDNSTHSGQHGSGGGGSGGGSMGQGLESPSENGTASTAPIKGNRRRSESLARFAGMNSGRRGSTAATDKRIASNSGTANDGKEPHDHAVGFPQSEREEMEACLLEVRGNLVVYPTRFLEVESIGGNFLFSRDRLPPQSIFN